MPRRIKLDFPGTDGLTIAGLLETPDSNPHSFALFAHCFTCGKDVVSASRIARALVARGYAVLRFDFTGLGNSDGDFANSNFSSNVNDLVLAADFLRMNYRAPSLLIGHSLGGAAVLAAADRIPEAAAVATIATPSDTTHLSDGLIRMAPEIEERGEAEIHLGGRSFCIRKQFIDDLRQQTLLRSVRELGRALLVLHSPVDEVVEVEHARRIFETAKYPKSFISLDGADHLLMKDRKDARYVADVLAAWSSRYLA